MTRGPHCLRSAILASALAALLATPAVAQRPNGVANAPSHPDIVVNYPNLAAVPADAALGADRLQGALSAGSRRPAALAVPGGSSLSGITVTSYRDSAATVASPPSDPSLSPNRILFDVAPRSAFTPYIGLGLGGSATGSALPLHPTGSRLDTPDGTRSYQGLVGFAYTLDKGTKLDFGYRLSNSQRPNVPLADNADMPTAERESAAVLSLHYDLDLLK